MERYPDGRLDLLVQGVTRYRIGAVSDGSAPYYVANVEPIPDPPLDSQVAPLQQRLVAQHMRLLELSKRTPRPSVYQTNMFLSYLLAHNCGLSLDQKQELLGLPTETARLLFLTQHLEHLIPQVEHKEEVRKKVQSNGHFRDFPV